MEFHLVFEAAAYPDPVAVIQTAAVGMAISVSDPKGAEVAVLALGEVSENPAKAVGSSVEAAVAAEGEDADQTIEVVASDSDLRFPHYHRKPIRFHPVNHRIQIGISVAVVALLVH